MFRNKKKNFQSSPLLKEIFTAWNWDVLTKHINGIKSNFILSDPSM